MRELKKDFVLLSAELGRNSDTENERNTEELESILQRKFPDRHVKCYGMYEGIGETSFLVTFDSAVERDFLKHLAIGLYGQHSVLIRESDRVRFFMFDGTSAKIRQKFKRVPENVAKNQTGWTKINTDYWILS